jgi:hypothetical protein
MHENPIVWKQLEFFFQNFEAFGSFLKDEKKLNKESIQLL